MENKQINESQMLLYGIDGLEESIYFSSEEELMDYMLKEKVSPNDTVIIEYLGPLYGRKDVIRKTYKNGRKELLVAVDEDGYGIYNLKRSIDEGKDIWEYNYGTDALRDEYEAFKSRGIILENDIYAKIDEEKNNFIKMCQKKNLFNSQEKK